MRLGACAQVLRVLESKLLIIRLAETVGGSLLYFYFETLQYEAVFCLADVGIDCVQLYICTLVHLYYICTMHIYTKYNKPFINLLLKY